jgi:hydrogenase nickel incorporation protein HypA/HybF
MHELAAARDIVRKAEAMARRQGAARVVSVMLRQGAFSGLSADSLRAHFTEAAAGTLAEGARIELIADDHAQELTLESVELEVE